MRPRLLARAVVGVAAALATVAPLAGCSNASEPASSTSGPLRTPPTSTPPGADGTTGSTEYADGTYTARGDYGGAPSYMDFTVSLDDGVVTDVESELMPDNNDTSRGYQERFAAAVPDEVIGESIADLEVGVIAGASGCADGFNDALAKIRQEASTNAGRNE